jgi:oxidase EvaA
MAPTVQCITGSYTKPEYEIPYLEYFIQKGKGKIMHDSLQSEEGGRFFHEQNRYVVIEVEDEFSNDVKERYIWMTLGQVKDFIKFNNYFNIEARSLIACISPI